MPKGRVGPTRETPQTGDLIGHTGNHSATNGSAQEQYYRYMLMKEKLGGKGDAILKATSEREDIEVQILQKLVNITESTPEFAQIVSITGSSDRFEQARILAESVYDKIRAEQVLSFYTPSKAVLEANFYNKTLASAQDRVDKVNAGKTAANAALAANPLTGLLNAITGGGAGGSESTTRG